jgi:signal transduction histidine kinase
MRYSAPIAATASSADPVGEVQDKVNNAALMSGARVTLMAVATAVAPGGPQLSPLADSSNVGSSGTLGLGTAQRAIRTKALATGVEQSAGGALAEAAEPVLFDGEIVRVIVFSEPVSDEVRNVAVIRHDIIVAGVIALVLALIGGYLVARSLAARVKRLEEGAKRIAAGDFGEPIPVDSRDELGQLAAAFNDMQRQLTQLEQARKKFIATASHELRTPVFSLGGFVELLEDEELDEETRTRFLGQVRQQVERLAKLSVDLLDLSRLEAGSLELRPETVDLAELARSVSSEFEPVLAQHDSRLEMRLPSWPVEALCDPVRVAQIVRILIDNALTHTSAGTGIVVSARRDNGFAWLAVRDHGTGIKRGALSQIFEPFYTSDDAQGSGLGLAIASELAERMNGRLGVESRPGRTVFTLELPA